jgi:hypothetical protein
MLEIINTIIIFLQNYPLIFFVGLGYFNGYLFRNIGFIKVILMIFVVPFCLDLLINVNQVFVATLPFLVSAIFGFMGVPKSKYHLSRMSDMISQWKQK